MMSDEVKIKMSTFAPNQAFKELKTKGGACILKIPLGQIEHVMALSDRPFTHTERVNKKVQAKKTP